jgi:hypothetical protein
MVTRLNVIGAGIFSKYMRLIQYMAKQNLTIENTYLDVSDLTTKINQNMINFCIQQMDEPGTKPTICDNFHTYDKTNKIENSAKFQHYKSTCSKMTFSSKLNELISESITNFLFDENTIGVHIRLCDMNTIHGKNYGVHSFTDFKNEIDKILTSHSRIFVASDNDESLKKLKEIYEDKVFFVPNMIRVQKETDNSYQLQIDNMMNGDFWIQSFLDMYLLSKCSKLVCRTSNLSNAAICFSNSIQQTIRL